MNIYDLKLKGIIIYSFIFCFLIFYPIYLLLSYRAAFRYEYKDFDNITGLASYCSYQSSGWQGQGAMVCRLNDGTIFQVKSYKKYR